MIFAQPIAAAAQLVEKFPAAAHLRLDAPKDRLGASLPPSVGQAIAQPAKLPVQPVRIRL